MACRRDLHSKILWLESHEHMRLKWSRTNVLQIIWHLVRRTNLCKMTQTAYFSTYYSITCIHSSLESFYIFHMKKRSYIWKYTKLPFHYDLHVYWNKRKEERIEWSNDAICMYTFLHVFSVILVVDDLKMETICVYNVVFTIWPSK